MNEKDIQRFWAKVDVKGEDECWNWTAYKQKNGYGQFGIGRQCLVYAHRVSAYLAGIALSLNRLHTNDQVCHTCDNPSCVNPKHLFNGTAKDNADDRDIKGRTNSAKGGQSGNAKLSAQDIVNIRTEYIENGVAQKDLALQYQVHPAHISKIVNNKKWSWL
jgi:hypothetical protein